jgi:drug/metabolite transporter (DMT)-like permease
MGTAVLFLFLVRRGQWASPSRSDLPYFALLGFIGIAFHQWLQSTGLVTAQATTTAWVVASIPVFIAVLGWFVLGERLTLAGTAGIAVSAAGVLVVVSRGAPLRLLAAPASVSAGDLLVLASAPNWAVFSVLSRRGLKRHASAFMMFWVMLFGWLFLSALALGSAGSVQLAGLSARVWAATLFLGFGCSGLAYVYWYDALAALPAARVGQLLFLEPLVAVIVAAAMLGEPASAASLIGGAAVLAGVWIVNRPNAQSRSKRAREALQATLIAGDNA